MGNKIVCVECRKCFNQGTDFHDRHESRCPDCGQQMIILPHRFRPPKRTELNKWKTVKFLVEHGFRFQHIYKDIKQKLNSTVSYENLVPYPENLRDAKDFVERYKQQAINQ